MIVEKWVREHRDQKERDRILELRQRYEFLSKNLFNEYQPTKKATSRHQHEFMMRLDQWLAHIPEDEQRRTAFRSIEYLFFAGVEEFDELYRCALVEAKRWLLEINDIDPFDSDKAVNREIKSTWFCPISDSFRINSFLHVAGISGDEYRPDWFSLRRFASEQKILCHLTKKRIKNLVLLEDFVGSGRQALKVLRFAAEILDINILVVPLIICAPGMHKMVKFARSRPSVSIRPIVVLPKNCLISVREVSGEPWLFKELRPVMRGHYKRLNRRAIRGDFGFHKVGSMVVTYSNCPNNTPPLYHAARDGETALFPRLARPWNVG